MKIRPAFGVRVGMEDLVSTSGIEFVGMALGTTDFRAQVNTQSPKGGYNAISTADCMTSMIGLLCAGKSAFDDIREFQENPRFFASALGNKQIPSAETLRQTLDKTGKAFDESEIAQHTVTTLLRKFNANITMTSSGHAPIDCDVSPHDNSNTKKEGLGWTYKQFDGFAPIYAYLGMYLINLEFREGSQNGQKDAPAFFEQSIHLAREVTEAPLLFRLDSGHDAQENVNLFVRENVDYLIKRNLRKESACLWMKIALETEGVRIEKPREGKIVCTGSIYTKPGEPNQTGLAEYAPKGERIVFVVTARESDARGQMLVEPSIDVATWRTSLDVSDDEVIQLYREHAVCEQYHSELKTDMDLERFPSGKRDTNAAVLKLAMMAACLLNIIGEMSLSVGTAKQRHPVRRIRLRTVMQRFIYIAARVTRHAKEVFLTFGKRGYWRDDYIRIHHCLSES
jgi:hypothetical protein